MNSVAKLACKLIKLSVLRMQRQTSAKLPGQQEASTLKVLSNIKSFILQSTKYVFHL